MIRRFLCWVGLHKTETHDLGHLMNVTVTDKKGNETKEDHIYYSICKYCGDGNPLITGEW